VNRLKGEAIGAGGHKTRGGQGCKKGVRFGRDTRIQISNFGCHMTAWATLKWLGEKLFPKGNPPEHEGTKNSGLN